MSDVAHKIEKRGGKGGGGTQQQYFLVLIAYLICKWKNNNI